MSIIITSDWHIRSNPPVARIDDYEQAQWDVIKELVDYVKEADSPLIVAGDMFHTAKPTLYLVMKLFEALSGNFLDIYAIPGQHDLPGHLWSRVNESGIGLLYKCGIIGQMDGWLIKQGVKIHLFPYGTDIQPLTKKTYDWHMAVCHTLVTNGTKSVMTGAESARKFLRKMTGYDLVVVGDNHQTFMVEDNGRYLLSPGSLLRTNADQMDHEPCLWEWEPGDVPEPLYYDCVKNPEHELTRGYIESKEEKDERIEAFVTTINNDYDVSLSFSENMESFLRNNKQRKQIVDLVNQHLEGEFIK